MTAKTSREAHRKRVLLLEDSKPMSLLITSIFKKHYDVFSFDNAISAFDWLKRGNEVDLIVTDYYLPGMNGFEFTKNLRTSGYSYDVPIFFLTNANHSQIPPELYLYDIEGVIQKPFEPNQLLFQINNMFLEKARVYEP